MSYLRTIFWTSIVWIVAVAAGYVYTFFRDKAVVIRLYPSLTGSAIVSTQTGIVCDLSGINMKLDAIQQDVSSIASSLAQSSGSIKPAMPSIFVPNQSSSASQQITISVVDSAERLVSVERSIPRGANEIADAVSLLLAGELSDREKAQGLSSLFGNAQFQLKSANIDALGVLSLEFTEVPGFTNGGSARVLLMKTAIEKTARQFPQVKSVIIKPDTILQP